MNNFNKMKSISFLSIVLCALIFFTLAMPFYNIINSMESQVSSSSIFGSNLLINLCSGTYLNNIYFEIVAVSYIMLLLLSLVFLAFAILRMNRTNINKKILQAIAFVMLGLSIVIFILCYVLVSQNDVIVDRVTKIKYYVSAAPYVMMLSSIFIACSTTINRTFCVYNKI